MGNRISGFFKCHALLILAGCGVLSLVLYLQFIIRPALIFDYYANPINYGTMVGANRGKAFITLGIFFIQFLLYGTAWWAASQVTGKKGWFLVLGWGFLFSLVFLFMYPYGARDIFDYILRARLFAVYNQNPFFQTASEFPTDIFYRFGWWREYPSPYGPLWELTAALGVHIAGDDILANIFVFKGISAVFLFMTTGVVAFTLNKLSPVRAIGGTLGFLWNPVLLFEIVGNAHNDITMLLWVAASVWAAGTRRWKWVIWFLAIGAAFKFVPILLLPAAGLLGLMNTPSIREKIKFLLLSGAGCLLIWIAAYLPFWNGWKTLAFFNQGTLFTTSLPSLIFSSLQPYLGQHPRQVVGYSAIIVTLIFVVWMSLKLVRKPDWISYVRISTHIFLFYVLVTCAWYQNWYLLWPLTMAVFLPVDKTLLAAVFFSFIGLVKPFYVMPVYAWLAKPSFTGLAGDPAYTGYTDNSLDAFCIIIGTFIDP